MRRLAVLGGLSALLAGCPDLASQLASVTQPSGGSASQTSTPAPSNQETSAPETSGTVRAELDGPLFSQPGTSVQALDAMIARIRFKLTGAALEAPLALDVARAAFAEGVAVAEFTDLEPGQVKLVAYVRDDEDRLLATATGEGEVRAGATTTIELEVTPMAGDASLNFDPDDAPDPQPTVHIGEAGNDMSN